MSVFSRRGGGLWMEDAPLSEIAARYGTPCYVYSRRALTDSVARLREMFRRSAPRIFYAVKANGNLSLLRLLREAGCGFDIVSAGELARVLASGGDAAQIVFSGAGKSAAEIRAALDAGIGCFNVESAAELARLEEIAAATKTRAPLAIRANPDIDGGTHPHLTTGVRGGKFGVPPSEARTLARTAADSQHLDFRGFACHIGSQIGEVSAYLSAAAKMDELIRFAREDGIAVRHVDMGGGFAVNYETGADADWNAAEYDADLARRFSETEIWLEPGRAVAARAGVLLSRVEYVKQNGDSVFWIADAGMNDFPRPALYGARHIVEETETGGGRRTMRGAVAGPVCESADILARDCELAAAAGDVLAVRDAGAYCAAMFSGYNARPRPCEVLVSGGETRLIRRRETVAEMLSDEKSLL